MLQAASIRNSVHSVVQRYLNVAIISTPGCGIGHVTANLLQEHIAETKAPFTRVIGSALEQFEIFDILRDNRYPGHIVLIDDSEEFMQVETNRLILADACNRAAGSIIPTSGVDRRESFKFEGRIILLTHKELDMTINARFDAVLDLRLQ